jgi:hypothetical protein
MSSFKQDLYNAQQIEFQIMESIMSSGHTCTSTASFGIFPDYDIVVKPLNKPQFKAEIKHDIKHTTTQKVAIETGKVRDGYIVKSGLSITKADYYIYQLEDKKYMIKTDRLKKLLHETSFQEMVGGDFNTVMTLVPVDVFKQWFTRF